jgi:LAGLIDADG DNA endonuclease family protein
MSIAKRLYRCDELAFTRSTAESAYWFGFILADGCIYESARHSPNLSVALAEKDLPLLETFQRFLKSNHPMTQRPKPIELISSRQLHVIP